MIPALGCYASTLPRRTKQSLLLLSDIIAILFALWAALALRLETLAPPIAPLIPLMLLSPLIAVPVFIRLGLYRAIVRYIGLHALATIVQAVIIYTALLIAAIYLLALTGLPRSLPLIHGVLTLLLIGASRTLPRHWLLTATQQARHRQGNHRRPVVIYGAGSAGVQLASALAHTRELAPVAFVDDDPALRHSRIGTLRVYGPDDLLALIERHAVTEVLLAMPSTSRTRRNEIIACLDALPVKVRTLPGVAELAEGKVQTADLREVDIEDLLGRDPVPPDPGLLGPTLTGKVVMVTGAGGSIGSELCRQIAALAPRALILFEHSEFALYALEQELRHRHSVHSDPSAMPLIPLLGSVTDPARIEQAIQAFGVQTLFHAAAYKHVPMVEHNPLQGIANNILGTWRTAQAALRQGVETFVLISTDKAVRPTNTMGATKRFAEMILQTLHAQHPEGTHFTMVRFGNVLGSSGSVVPLFRSQIRRGGPVTVTDPRITRYFMTIPEAAQLVIQAGGMGSIGQGGDVFVLDMGEPVRILDLARRMIHLSGLTEKTPDNPEGDIEIVFSGLRPGEKLYEELLIGNNVSPTTHPRILRASEKTLDREELEDMLRQLQKACETGDSLLGRELLLKAVGEFSPQCGNQDMTNHPPGLK